MGGVNEGQRVERGSGVSKVGSICERWSQVRERVESIRVGRVRERVESGRGWSQ